MLSRSALSHLLERLEYDQSKFTSVHHLMDYYSGRTVNLYYHSKEKITAIKNTISRLTQNNVLLPHDTYEVRLYTTQEINQMNLPELHMLERYITQPNVRFVCPSSAEKYRTTGAILHYHSMKDLDLLLKHVRALTKTIHRQLPMNCFEMDIVSERMLRALDKNILSNTLQLLNQAGAQFISSAAARNYRSSLNTPLRCHANGRILAFRDLVKKNI